MSEKAGQERLAEKALAGIPGFSGALIGRQLSNGPTNSSYLVTLQGGEYVLRLDKPEAGRLGLKRQNEAAVVGALAAAGLALEPIYFEPSAGIYLRRFLPGRSWSASDLAEVGNLERLAGRLRKLHALPPVGSAFEPLAAARRYAEQLNCKASRSILHRAEKQFKKTREFFPRPVLCHNDLVCQNILESEPLMLIDWEYAGVGDPFFDLAVVVQHHGLQAAAAEVLLRAYMRDSYRADAVDKLETQCRFYQCLLELWDLRVHPET